MVVVARGIHLRLAYPLERSRLPAHKEAQDYPAPRKETCRQEEANTAALTIFRACFRNNPMDL